MVKKKSAFILSGTYVSGVKYMIKLFMIPSNSNQIM